MTENIPYDIPATADKPKPRTDKKIWGIYIALLVVSAVELYSASSRDIVNGRFLDPILRHLVLLAAGFMIMLVLQRFNYRKLYNYAFAIGALCVAASVYTMFNGLIINGARRAFSFFGLFTVQPSELLKFGVALVLARLLCNYIVHPQPGREQEADKYNKTLLRICFGVIATGGVLLFTQGLTNTLLLGSIGILMMVIGAVRWKQLAIFVLALAALGTVGYLGKNLLRDREHEVTEMSTKGTIDRSATHLSRLSNYVKMDKYNDPLTPENAQDQYSHMAQANGGILGCMPGNSRETSRLPLAFSDFIYAIIIEDTGLVGGLTVLVLYLLLLARAGYIAMKCRKAFPALLVIGMAVFITCQAMIHMGIVSGALPVSGQPLPLISKGGSSVIVTSIALGIMLSVSRHAERRDKPPVAVAENDDTPHDADLFDNPSQL